MTLTEALLEALTRPEITRVEFRARDGLVAVEIEAAFDALDECGKPETRIATNVSMFSLDAAAAARFDLTTATFRDTLAGLDEFLRETDHLDTQEPAR